MSAQRPCRPIEYAFFESLPFDVIKTYKKLIREFMEKEGTVYELTFKYYVFSLNVGVNRDRLSDTFCATLHGRLISLQHNASDKVLEVMKILGHSAFEEYWRMAVKTDYWRDGQKEMNKLLPHQDVVEKWQRYNQDVLSDSEFKLLEFRGALES